MPAQQRVRLHDEQRGAPPTDEARQEDEAEAVGGGGHGPLDLAGEDHELLAQEGILGDQRGLRPSEIADCSTDARSGRGSGPREEATVDRAQRGLSTSSDRRRDGPEHARPLSLSTVPDMPQARVSLGFPQHSASGEAREAAWMSTGASIRDRGGGRLGMEPHQERPAGGFGEREVDDDQRRAGRVEEGR